MSGNGIGELSERSLHAALKAHLQQPGDAVELPLDGYVIDIVRGDQLIEIQTRHLYALRKKFRRLLPDHAIHLVHPIAAEKWIVREDADGRFISRRKSPKKGQVVDVFRELVRVPDLLRDPHFTLEVLLIREEEVWRDDGQGSWRRKGWSRVDRQLAGIVASEQFDATADYLRPLPASLAEPFTNRQLAKALRCRPDLAGKISYTLRQLDLLEVVGKEGNAYLHVRCGGKT